MLIWYNRYMNQVIKAIFHQLDFYFEKTKTACKFSTNFVGCSFKTHQSKDNLNIAALKQNCTFLLE